VRPFEDSTPLRELRANIVAAAAVFVFVGFWACAVVALVDWIK
jgi:hypothetical protein